MDFRIIQVVPFVYKTLFTLASMFWRQRHNVRVSFFGARLA